MAKNSLERSRERRALGLCNSCAQMARPGKVTCADCAEKLSIKYKAKYQAKKALNVCVACISCPPVEGYTHCQACLDKYRDKQAERRKTTWVSKREIREKAVEERKAKSLCIDCGTVEATVKTRCAKCDTIYRLKEADPTNYARRKALGICQNCQNPAAAGNIRCNACRLKRAGERQQRRLTQVCVACGVNKTSGKARCTACIANAKELYEARKTQGLCPCCGDTSATAPGLECTKCNERRRAGAKARRHKLGKRVFAAYGGYTCSCCGETHKSCLTIDHVHNDGATHRKHNNLKSSTQFYRWLELNKFPEGFQVLCFNCNISKYRDGGKCCINHKHANVQ